MNIIFEMNDMNENIGETILIPVAFIVGGFILTFLLPFIHSNRRRSNRRDGMTSNEKLSEREIDYSITIKVGSNGTYKVLIITLTILSNEVLMSTSSMSCPIV